MHSASSTFRPTRLDGLAYIEPFYSAFASHVNVNVGVPLHIDLARLTFIHPEGVLALLTAARYWHRLTGQRVLCTNIPPDIHAYLDRADLFKTCAAYLVVDTRPRDRLFRSAQSYKLLEVTAISGDPASNDKDMTNAVRRMKHILDAWYKGEHIGQLCTLLSEIASNITHSLDHGYAIMQRYAEPGTSGSRVHVGIADMGIGIQASLARRHPNLQDELQVGSQYIL